MTEHVLDHVGIAVPTLDPVIPVWERLVGTRAGERETLENQSVEVVFIGSGSGRIELLAPTRSDSPVGRFLARRGPGLHHLAYRVPDIRTALEALAAEGYELVDAQPRRGAEGHLVAFLHPRAAGGVLIELVEGPSGDPRHPTP